MSQQNYKADSSVIDRSLQRSMSFPVFLFMSAILLIGYIDAFFITSTAVLNLLEKWLEDIGIILASILRWVKWCVIFVGIITVSLVGLAVWGIVKLFIG